MSQITMYAGEVNSPYTLLSAGIDADDTTIAVLELGVFPTAPNSAVLGSGSDAETILYTGKSAASGAGNLTGVTRAWNTSGSYGAAKSWIAGTVIARRFTAYDHDTFKANIEDLAARSVATDAIFDAAGDLIVGTGDNTAARLAKGSANQILHVKSDGSTLEWTAAPSGDVATDAIWDAAGDLVVGTGANTAAKLAKGTAYQVLRMKSDASTVEWGAAANEATTTVSVITIATSSNDDGSSLTGVNIGCNIGIIRRIRIYADQTLGQRPEGTFLINDGDGISPTDTSLAYDGLVGTLPTAGNEATGDYIWIDNELCRVSAGTSTPLTIVRGLCGTVAAFHDDNSVCRTANAGLKFKLFSANSESEANTIFELTKILTGKFTTDAAITAGDKVLTLSSSPAVLPDWGRGDPFIIDDTTDEINFIQAIYGAVSGTTYDDSIVPQYALAAHDTAKTVYRVVEYDTPIPFKLDGTATNLYVSIYPEQLIPGELNITIQFLIEKMG